MKKVHCTYIIEDDTIAAYLIKRSLEDHEQFENCLVFENGEKAIDHLTQKIAGGEHLPDLILLDLNMPVMNGWEFLEIFEKSPYSSNIPIFILSSSINHKDRQTAQANKHVKGFVSKPLDDAKLDSILHILQPARLP